MVTARLGERLGWLRRSRRGQVVVDGSVGAILLLLVVVQIAADGLDNGSTLFLLFAPAATLPPACRRVSPLVTIAIVAAAVLAQSLVTDPLPAFGEFLAVMLATYSVGAHTPRRVAVPGLVAAGLAVAVQGVRDPTATSAFEFVYGVVYFGGAWLIGRVVRARRGRVSALEAQTEHLEQEQEEPEERARLAVAHERQRIARELHDVIAHCVTVIIVQAGAAEQVVDRDPTATRDALRSIRAVGNEALAEMRRLLGVLREDGDELRLDPQPGLARLDELVSQAGEAGLSVQVTSVGQPRPLPPGVDLAAYRVVQEALTNVRKHAPTGDAAVHLQWLPDAISVEIINHGPARTVSAPETDGAGQGLIGMRERVALYGGVMTATPHEDAGFTVSVRLPTGDVAS